MEMKALRFTFEGSARFCGPLAVLPVMNIE